MQNFIEKSKNNDEMKIGEYNKILACFSDDYEIYKHNGSINKIYSLILDEGNENQTFSIYLENNLMVESCNEKYINKFTLFIQSNFQKCKNNIIHIYNKNMSDITQIGSNISGRVSSVSINGSGNIVAIANRNSNSYKGETKIYKWNGTSWGQLGGGILGESNYDNSGNSVSLNDAGTILAIGANYNDGNGNSSGHTRIFQYNSSSNSWTQLGGDIDGEVAGDQSGKSVSLNDAGDRVAIGAYLNDGGGSDSGHVRIYEYDNSSNAWNQLGGDIDGEASSDKSGYSVSLNSLGDIVAIGAYLNDENGSNSGHTRIYEYNSSSNTWTQLGQDIDGEAVFDYSGKSVSLNSAGDIVAIGAPFNSGGHTKIFQYNGTDTWNQLGGDIDGEDSGDESGTSVSLNSAGDIVAIGDIGFFDGAGNLNGQVRIFKYDGTNWVQFGIDIDGQSGGDKFGASVSLNSQGNIVTIIGNTYTQVYELDIDLNLDDLNSDVSMVSPVVDATWSHSE